jgi:Domain of unknown function (DUF4260)
MAMTSGAVVGAPKFILRLERAALALGTALFFWRDDGSIWLAHIGADRALGQGLKYATAFGDTHLGYIGR